MGRRWHMFGICSRSQVAWGWRRLAVGLAAALLIAAFAFLTSSAAVVTGHFARLLHLKTTATLGRDEGDGVAGLAQACRLPKLDPHDCSIKPKAFKKLKCEPKVPPPLYQVPYPSGTP